MIERLKGLAPTLKRVIMALLLLLPPTGGHVLFAQSKIDSLLTLLKKDKEDTNKVNHLSKLCIEYWWTGKNDTALLFGNKAMKLARNLDFKSGIASAANNIGFVFSSIGNYPKALENYFNALKMNEKLLEEAKLNRDTSAVLQKKIKIGKNLMNIGIVYEIQKDFSKALEYYFKSLDLFYEAGDQYKICVALGNIGIIYVGQGDTAKGQDCYFRALQIAENIGKKSEVSRNLGNLGIVFLGQKDFKKALDYFTRALDICEKHDDKYKTPIWVCNIGAVFIEQGRYSEAEEYLLRAKSLYSMVDDKYGIIETERHLSKLYEKTGKFSKALEHYKNAMVLKDTLFNEEKNKEITRKEMNYEFEKKEAAAKAEADKQAAVAEAEKQRQRIVLILVSCVLLLVVVFAGFIFRALRITQKQKQLIEQQKKMVEEKQNEILASIRYAKRIQDVILPTEKYIDKTLKRLMKNN